jgi:hypothetical protein
LLSREEVQRHIVTRGGFQSAPLGAVPRERTEADWNNTFITSSIFSVPLAGVGLILYPITGSLVGLPCFVISMKYLLEERFDHRTWHWIASKAENVLLWLHNAESSRRLGGLTFRGLDVGRVIFIGPPCVEVVTSRASAVVWETTLKKYLPKMDY